MIYSIYGTIEDIQEDTAILVSGNIGFEVHMPSSDLYKLGIGETNVKLFTYMAVKEDDISLFGFLSAEEQNMFRLLIGVSGIGPKGALNILSTLDVDSLKKAIVREDAKLIAKSPGLGLKTAQKLILELKGRFEKEPETSEMNSENPDLTVSIDALPSVRDALEALEALGFARKDALAAIRKVEHAEDMDASKLAGAALKNMY